MFSHMKNKVAFVYTYVPVRVWKVKLLSIHIMNILKFLYFWVVGGVAAAALCIVCVQGLNSCAWSICFLENILVNIWMLSYL